MRLPNLSSAAIRQPATAAGLLAGRVAPSHTLNDCGAACDPLKNQCTNTNCPHCKQAGGPTQHTCQP